MTTTNGYHLPDEVIETARQLLDSCNEYQWGIGDLLVEVVDELTVAASGFQTHGSGLSRSGIIRELSIRTGTDASTLRDRECMARFYPVPLRQEYSALTYYQLRACKSAGPDHWRAHADWALDNLPAPSALIRARVKHNGELPPAWVSRWERLCELAELLLSDDQTPADIRRALDLLQASNVMG
jgi:hypothetical protein